MQNLPGLLLIAGTGRNSGKTTLACRIIERYSEAGIIAVKISPHLHVNRAGVSPIIETAGYTVYRETSLEGIKDSSRMLVSGATGSYYIQTSNEYAEAAFLELFVRVGGGVPLVCESPSLRRWIEPGVFLVADSGNNEKRKNLGIIYDMADMIILQDNLESAVNRLGLKEGCWLIS